MNYTDYIGKKIGRLLILELFFAPNSRNRMARTKCDCGNIKITRLSSIINGYTLSCGCLMLGNKNAAIHEMTATPTYISWRAMLNRCTNPHADQYISYGGRGIKVCDRWENFENFLEDMGVRPINTTLNRLNNEGNYSPDNCIWSTIQEQARNRITNLNIEFMGMTKCLAEWADYLGVSRMKLASRLRRGWTIEEAFTIKVEETE